jgi:hypothetical protein
MSATLMSRGLSAPSRSAARALLNRAAAAPRAMRAPQRSLGSVPRCVPLRAAASGATSLVRRVLLGGLVASGLSAQSGARAMAAGGAPIPAPSDVAAPPADATVTPSGLASKVLTAGSGACSAAQRSAAQCSVATALTLSANACAGSGNPSAADKVTVDYTG